MEGYYAAANARALAQKAGVEMPIAQAAYEVLYENRSVHGVVDSLMQRAKRSEMEESWTDKKKMQTPTEKFRWAFLHPFLPAVIVWRNQCMGGDSDGTADRKACGSGLCYERAASAGRSDGGRDHPE